MKVDLESIFAMLCAVVVITSPVACTVHADRQIAKAIEHGIDPIQARCAYETFPATRLCDEVERRRR